MATPTLDDRKIIDKDLGVAGFAALNKRSRFLYPALVTDENGEYVSGEISGASFSVGNADLTKGRLSPPEAIIHLVNEGSPTVTNADNLLTALQKPVVEPDGGTPLQINTDVGTEVVADTHLVVASGSEKKWIKMVLGMDDVSGALEIFALERLDSQVYGSLPGGKTFVADLKEFSTPVSGTSLTEEKSFL